MQLNLYLFRHAQSTGNLDAGRIGGRSSHLDLSDLGHRQALALGQRLKHLAPKLLEQGPIQLYSSPALRCLKTATLALEQVHHSWPQKLGIENKLLELSQGEWEGKIRQEVHQAPIKQAMQAEPWHFKAPKGESQFEVEQRLYQWLEPFTQGQDNQHIWAFSHAMAIKCLSRKLLGSAPRQTWLMYVENTALTHFRFETHRGWSLRQFNDFSHLNTVE